MTPLRKHSGKHVFPLADTLRFLMFPSDFRFRNHVFPQSLTCAYVAETRYSVPETCYFVRSTVGNVKIRSGNLTCFSVFPSVSVTALICPKSFIFAETRFSNGNFSLFLHEINLWVFFLVNLHAMKTCSLYVRQIYTTIKLKSICVAIKILFHFLHIDSYQTMLILELHRENWSYRCESMCFGYWIKFLLILLQEHPFILLFVTYNVTAFY